MTKGSPSMPPEGAFEEASTGVLDGPKKLVLPSIQLAVIDGPDRGLRLDRLRGVTRIGTAAGNELRLTDPTVSRVHADLVHNRSSVRLRDAGSTNGTFVEGVRVRDADLEPGATLRLGSTTLRLELGGQPLYVEVSSQHRFGDVIGRSLEMRRVYALAERVAPTDTTVLVEGETGTGKEVLARAIHAHSQRARAPFVAIDCGAIAESLIESELFGHVRGAFSGAVDARAGVFEEANGGTLFFDEIGELSLALQKKLLRVLETREVRRVGGNTATAVDVRVLAATNRSLAESVNMGEFREDLYYRLAVVTIELPPLRARREDIPLLAAHFLERFRGCPTPLPQPLIPALLTRGWPGNVRELRNFIERSISLGWSELAPSIPAPPLDLDASLDPELYASLPLKDARARWTEHFEAAYVRAVLRECDGNVTRAAERAGVNRRFLQRIMARLSIRAVDALDEEGLDSDDDRH